MITAKEARKQLIKSVLKSDKELLAKIEQNILIALNERRNYCIVGFYISKRLEGVLKKRGYQVSYLYDQYYGNFTVIRW